MSRQNNIDLLRLILAISVYYSHFIFLTDSQLELGVFFEVVNSDIAVKSFFVLSGFLIWKSMINTSSLMQYTISRGARLFPGLIVMLLLTITAVNILQPYPLIESLSYLNWNVILLSFVQPSIGDFMVDSKINALNGSLWTLKVEFLYYIFIGSMYFISKRKALFVIIIFSFFSLSLYYFAPMIGITSKSLLSQIPFTFYYFGFGVVSFELLNRFKFEVPLWLVIVSLIVHVSFPGTEIFNLVFILSLVFYISFSLPLLLDLRKFGDISYGLYIYHFPVIQIFLAAGIIQYGTSWNQFLLVSLVVFLLSFFSWKVVEFNAINFMKTRR
ncbi:acyltransferase family protein [Vibrio crassostreae]|uniref:acyltransferase family protein n=1 Tax=Vibrio crassostreae TaxID=246167 RepID=UPI0002D5DF3D|nr:acyltransferase [Vibrio crassostreae]OEE90368.1 hypothetical protein A140_03380 [Vibrio crassostreae 9ZC88]